MINLIPKEEREKKSKDFHLRVVVVSLVTFGFSMLVAALFILPSYFTSFIEKNSFDKKIEVQKNEPIPLPDQNALMAIEDLKNKMNLIENVNKNKSTFSERILNKILLKNMSGIKITGILYKNDAQTGEVVNINGVAISRDSLLLFRRALENDTAFSKIDLPVSNFVKGSDIKFSLSLIPS